MDKNKEINIFTTFLLAVQHIFAMFGATVLVPFLTGLDPGMAILASGIGTLLFHFITKGKVPAYLGSSFAYIAALAFLVKEMKNPGAAMGAVFIVGILYIAVYGVVRVLGTETINKYIPPVVVGPVVMIIGLSLARTAVNDMASTNWSVAIFTLIMAIVFSAFTKGFLKIIPVLLGITSGYILAAFLGLVDFTQVAGAPVIHHFQWIAPAFDLSAILLMAPIVLVTVLEDLGHIFVLENIIGKPLMKDPGFKSVLLGNGLGTIASSLVGGPPLTTYGENIGVLSITKVYNSRVIQLAAVIAILLSFFGKLSALISTIPAAVMGGICILLFGMIAAAGIRTLVDDRTDLSSTKNLIIIAVILIIGVGSEKVGYATLAGILLNLILPEDI
ncbi:MAG: uracil-xanthine permease family protein [Peptococcaceae bacterium]